MRRLGLVLLALALGGCQRASAAASDLPLPTARVSVPTTRVTLVASLPSRSLASLAGLGSSLQITVDGPDLTPTQLTATGSLGAGTFVVGNVPEGTARLFTVQALDAHGNLVQGAVQRAVADLESPAVTVSISPRSNAAGAVYAQLYTSAQGKADADLFSVSQLQGLLDQIAAAPPGVPDYGLLDGAKVGQAIVADGGILPAVSSAFQIAPATVSLTVAGAPPNVPLEVQVQDPVSQIGSGLSRWVTLSGDTYTIAPVLPGTWPLVVSGPGLGSRAVSVSVGAGQVATASVDFSTWAAGPPLPAPLGDTGAAAIGSKIFVVGGVAQGGDATDSVFVLDTSASSPAWQRLASLPQPLEGAGVAAVNGKLVVCGGESVLQGVGATRFSSTYLYDPVANAWTQKSTMPASFVGGPAGSMTWGGLAAAASGSVVYAFNAIGEVGLDVDLAAAYDQAADVWSVANLPVPPTARILDAATTLGNRVYLAGGMKLVGDPNLVPPGNPETPLPGRPEFEALDLSTSPPVWHSLAEMPTGRSELGLAASATKIYAAGGADANQKPLDIVEVFDPSTGAWSASGALAHARSSFSLVAAGNRLWAIGGSASRWLSFNNGSSANATDSVEVMALPEGSP